MQKKIESFEEALFQSAREGAIPLSLVPKLLGDYAVGLLVEELEKLKIKKQSYKKCVGK
jgi:hypothetical protein